MCFHAAAVSRSLHAKLIGKRYVYRTNVLPETCILWFLCHILFDAGLVPGPLARHIQFDTCLLACIGSVYLAYVLVFVLRDLCVVCISTYLVNGYLLYDAYKRLMFPGNFWQPLAVELAPDCARFLRVETLSTKNPSLSHCRMLERWRFHEFVWEEFFASLYFRASMSVGCRGVWCCTFLSQPKPPADVFTGGPVFPPPRRLFSIFVAISLFWLHGDGNIIFPYEYRMDWLFFYLQAVAILLRMQPSDARHLAAVYVYGSELTFRIFTSLW